MIGKIHVWHGTEIVDALKIPQRQGTGQIGHGHGIEPLHDEGEIRLDGTKGGEKIVRVRDRGEKGEEEEREERDVRWPQGTSNRTSGEEKEEKG